MQRAGYTKSISTRVVSCDHQHGDTQTPPPTHERPAQASAHEKGCMPGHPSVKKRQKEVSRKERQAEKLARRDERRSKRNDPTADAGATEPIEPGAGDSAQELREAPVREEAPTDAAPADGKA